MRKGQKVFLVYGFDTGIQEVKYQGKSSIHGKLLIKTKDSEYTNRVDAHNLFEDIESAISEFERFREERSKGYARESKYYLELSKEIKNHPIVLVKWEDSLKDAKSDFEDGR